MNELDDVAQKIGALETTIPCERSVLDMLRECFRTQPDSLAVKDTKGSINYGQLDLQSEKVAAELVLQNLQPEEPVAILLPASANYVVAMVGILKAGGCYLPIEPNVPDQRLEFLLRDAGCRFVFANLEGSKRLRNWGGKTLNLPEILSAASSAPKKIVPASPGPNHLAYVIYTSGSSGQPKGVAIEHRSLVNLVSAYRQEFNLRPGDRATMFSSVAFDASVAEIWPALCSGGSLLVPPSTIRQDPDSLIAWLAAEEITWTFLATGTAEILFGRTWPAQMPLRLLITGGDRLSIWPPPHLPFTVVNAYGPTENTVISTWSMLPASKKHSGLPAIGHPISNVTAYVLDEKQTPVAEGSSGELYLSGAQVARGYFGKPTLTAELFIPDPFTGKPGDRMYRTGDWVSRSQDGQLNFIGRRDNQVQIRGSRVELGEIETTLLGFASVRAACCVPRSENDLVTGVIAHVVSTTGSGDISAELRAHLAAFLPAYMQPAQFVFHEQLPLTPHGKVDRAALVDSLLKETPRLQVDEHLNGLEMALTRLWHSLLPGAVGRPKDARFATLGGDSLLLVNLMLGVERITDLRLEASAFLLDPTLPGLCEALSKRMAQTEFQPVLTLRKQGTRPPLFFLYHYNGDIDVYFELAEALGNDQPVYGIRSPALADLSRLPSSIEAAASEIIPWIRKIQPHGAPALVGFSWTNVLVFEVARQLAEQEGVSGFNAMIGGDAPFRPVSFGVRLLHFARHLPPWMWKFMLDGENRWRRLSRWQKLARGNLDKVHLPMSHWLSSPVSQHMVAIMEKYHPPKRMRVEVNLFRERGSYQTLAHPLHAWQTSHFLDGGWSRWTHKKVPVHWVEGNHDTILKSPDVTGLAQAILRAMEHNLNI